MKVRSLFLTATLIMLSVSLYAQTNVTAVPYIPLEKNPAWNYSVRIWEYAHDPITNPTAPIRWHELSIAELKAVGEDYNQKVTVLRYDPPNPVGQTIFGIYHTQLHFVLWMQRIAAHQYKPSPPVWGALAQIGETAKGKYNNVLSPGQNDAIGNIEWFKENGVWYPRTWMRYPNWAGQRWTEQWGPFGPGEFVERNYITYSERVWFNNRFYDGYKVVAVGPSEGDPNITATEAYVFVDGIGMISRYIDLTTGPAGIPANTMIFKHLATLQSVSFNNKP